MQNIVVYYVNRKLDIYIVNHVLREERKSPVCYRN